MLHLLIDENLDHRILRGLRLRLPYLDFVDVQDTDFRGLKDPPLLAWAAEHNRILVTHDPENYSQVRIRPHRIRRVHARCDCGS